MYKMKLRENLADGDVHSGGNGAGRWMLYKREYQTSKESGEQNSGEQRVYIHDIHGDIYLWEYCRNRIGPAPPRHSSVTKYMRRIDISLSHSLPTP